MSLPLPTAQLSLQTIPERLNHSADGQPSVEWYYKRDGRRSGPLPADEVARLVQGGHLSPSDTLMQVVRGESESGPSLRFTYRPASAALGEAPGG